MAVSPGAVVRPGLHLSVQFVEEKTGHLRVIHQTYHGTSTYVLGEKNAEAPGDDKVVPLSAYFNRYQQRVFLIHCQRMADALQTATSSVGYHGFRYGFDKHLRKLINADGSLAEGVGTLDCSTLVVLLVYDSLACVLVDYEQWPETPEDVAMLSTILEPFRNEPSYDPRIHEPRVRPFLAPQLVGAAFGTYSGMPMTRSECEDAWDRLAG